MTQLLAEHVGATTAPAVPRGFDAAALAEAIASMSAARRRKLAGIARWSWEIDGETVVDQHLAEEGGHLVYHGDADTVHRLVCGQASELEELLRGTVWIEGDVADAIASLRVLPFIGAAYAEAVGVADFEHRQINVLRLLRRRPLAEAGGFPDALTLSVTDQAHLVALILAGLPVACRSVQSAQLADVVRREPEQLAPRLVVLFSELADMVAGESSRNHRNIIPAHCAA